jgi:hypothetical protein
MANRKLLWSACVAFTLIIAIAVGLVLTSRLPRVTRQRFECVKKGMSWEEVIRAVGGPPGDYSSGNCFCQSNVRYPTYKSWLCDEGLLLVHFDQNGMADDVVVCNVHFIGSPRTIEQTYQLICQLMGG